ncbi:MAG: hypothetical protein GJ680_19255 [Alteromonadaceae bacterium]|nr:hypothetical protein [Alteromonadaceae bacterium]
MLTDDYITLSLHEHFDWQLKKGINLHSTHKYGGLNPNAFLFYNSSHKPFTLQKRGAGKLIPAALNKHIDEILKMTGLWSVGVKRPCFISTFINNAYKSNMSVTDIMLSSGLGEAAIQNHLILDYKQENPITNWYMSKKQNIESCTENFLERLMRIDEFRK